MQRITVAVRPPTKQGRLYPRYAADAGILAVESEVRRPWPFGVDINGNVVFDLDAQRVLANFDLHIPRKLWKPGLSTALPRALPGDIVFSSEAVAHKSFNLPLRVTTDPDSQCVLIEIADVRPTGAVALSDACVCFLSGTELAGFFVKPSE